MTSCCACCCFYPKYKRKVDNIYPRNYDLPLIKNEVDKLQYYVTVHPEKLSKIGDYLYQNLKSGLNNTYKYRNYIKNTIEAAEKILVIIPPQSLNYYAPNYLKIIQKLLEQGGSSTSNGTSTIQQPTTSNIIPNANMNGGLNISNTDSLEFQKLAANLFQKFCDKEASSLSTVNYNTNVDQFVCQFSSMCYNNNKDERIRAEIRSSGLQCLATMVKRLVPDDNLRAGYIWDNMDKIIPGLLYIMHENFLLKSNFNSLNDDADIEHELASYLQSDFLINTRLKGSSDLNNGEVNPEGVKVQFRRSIHENGEKNSDEANVMINLADNRMNNSNQLQVIDPDHEAKMLLKNISSKADYTTINKIVIPILAFLDDNRQNGWEMIKFVKCIFLILMCNVKQQHAIVIKELFKHLDSHRNSSAKLKRHIIKTIVICIRIAAMQSVGTAGQIIEIFTNLLKHLNLSVEKSSNLKTSLLNKSGTDMNRLQVEINEENKLQREIIEAMGLITSDLPDYAKNDVFMFIARQINSQQFNYIDLAQTGQQQQQQQRALNNNEQLTNQLRSKYFECLYEICTKYKPTQLFSAFTSGQFLDDILRLTLVSDWASRRKAHEILYQLLDKYQLIDKIKLLKPNLFLYETTSGVVNIKRDLSMNKSVASSRSSLSTSKSMSNMKPTRNQTYLSQLELNEVKFKASKEDIQFMRKNGRIFLSHINENLFLANNRRENYESIYMTICLFLIGLFNEKEFLIDLIRFGFHVQDLALLNHEYKHFTFALQCNIHKFVCAYFLLLSKSSSIPELYNYCSDICDLRRKKDLFKFIYPEYILLDTNLSSDSGIQSATASTSLTEIETEFKRDLISSGKEYVKFVQEISNLKNDSETKSKTSSNQSLSKIRPKLSPWLFDKNIVDDILKRHNYSSSNLFNVDSEFSLSIAYLQQSLLSLQSVLHYRSPYSNSYESIADFNNLPDDQTSTSATHRGHIRGYSGFGVSPSVTQFNQTPRRSIDVESNMDDDTSYDSASQISLDQNGYETEPLSNKFFVGDNQTTVNSLNYFKQQYVDITSFETLKRVLFNGSTNIVGSNLSSVAAGGGGSSTIGPGSSIAHSGVGLITSQPTTFLNQSNRDATDGGVTAAIDEEESIRIIQEIKQKPFNELKQHLLQVNHEIINKEKYNQVFDLINKEIVLSNNHQISNSNQSDLNQDGNLSASSMSTNGSNQSMYLNSNKELNNQPKSIALNDIDFPQLFMY